jgi:hypothetical protein
MKERDGGATNQQWPGVAISQQSRLTGEMMTDEASDPQ